jgi:hypothetical protein
MRRAIWGAALVGARGAFALAAAQNARVEARLRAANPDRYQCGLGFCGEAGVGLVCAAPGALPGAATGALVRRLCRTNGSNS